MTRGSVFATWLRIFVSRALFLALLLSFSGSRLWGQAQGYLSRVGTPPWTTPEPVEAGFVNLGNGNHHLEIQLASFPQRGSLPFVAKLTYDSRIWTTAFGSSWSWQPTNVSNSQGGWRFVNSSSAGASSYVSSTEQCTDEPPIFFYTVYESFSWTSPDGTIRSFPITTIRDNRNCAGGSVPSASAKADDSSGYLMVVTNYTNRTVYAPDGTQVHPTVKDTNGNYFDSQDTLGRVPLTVVANCDGNPNKTCYDGSVPIPVEK